MSVRQVGWLADDGDGCDAAAELILRMVEDDDAVRPEPRRGGGGALWQLVDGDLRPLVLDREHRRPYRPAKQLRPRRLP